MYQSGTQIILMKNLKSSQKETKIVTQREILLKDTLEKIEKCKHIKREGESCRLNNNCTYPDCKIENLHRSVQSVK